MITQAQIEAAAKILEDKYLGPTQSRHAAIAALTAAAEVGDKRWQEIANQGIHIETQLRKELLTIEAATIERCAQRFEEMYGHPKQEIAATIRALKDS